MPKAAALAELAPLPRKINAQHKLKLSERGKLKGAPIPIVKRLQVRTLYLSYSLSYREIATRTDLTEKQIANIVNHDKLTVAKRIRNQHLVAKAEANIDAHHAEFNEAAARESEELSLGALRNVRTRVERDGPNDAKEFQAITAGIMNLVKTSRTVRGLDNVKGSSESSGQVNVFILRGATIDTQPESVSSSALQAAIDVSAKLT